MNSKYKNLIGEPHHVSPYRPRMRNGDRAAQFAPFAALSGFGNAIDETARLTDRKIELDEGEKEELDRVLMRLAGKIKEQPAVTVTYFIPDERKAGGKYITADKLLKKIDTVHRQMIFTDGTAVNADDVLFLRSSD